MTRELAIPTLGQPLLSDAEVANQLGISRTSVRRLRYRGALKYVQVGGSVRMRPEDVAEYVDSQQVRP